MNSLPVSVVHFEENQGVDLFVITKHVLTVFEPQLNIPAMQALVITSLPSVTRQFVPVGRQEEDYWI